MASHEDQGTGYDSGASGHEAQGRRSAPAHPGVTIAGGENAVRCVVGQGCVAVYITHDIVIMRTDHFAEDGKVQSLAKAMDRAQFRALLDALNKIALRAHI